MNDLIKRLRQRKGVTQKKLADHLGIKQSTISRIESGAININLQTIIKIFLYLKASNREINDYLDAISSSNHYDFFSCIVQDEKIRKIINKDPFFYANKFKELLLTSRNYS